MCVFEINYNKMSLGFRWVGEKKMFFGRVCVGFVEIVNLEFRGVSEDFC